MHPEPVALAVERREEQVRARRTVQQCRRVAAPGHRGEEPGGEALRHRGGGQELAELAIEPGHHLVAQVVDQVPVRTGDHLGGGSRTIGGPEGDRGELERGCPPLGGPHQCLDEGGVRLDSRFGHEGQRLVDVEPQVVGAELDEGAVGAQASQWHGGILAADEHEVPERRHALDQPAEQFHRLRFVGQVAVVEHDDEVVVIGRHGVDDEIGEGAGVRRGAGRDRLREHRSTGPGVSERRQHLVRKPCRVAGGGVEADPGHRDGPVDDSARHGDRLAVAGRCGDEGQSRGRVERGVQPC